ncbi:3-hydroxyacyl-CoA dehydrogenase family protein, partial [Amycolatopsis sp. SID8362]|uniref:3-hydroxyacyl-CoA dehydrogenase family protein n=1 Tax=Amycolatopsis sp. SID8362 TaxID=2690346 RepID=UPI001371C89B
VPERLDLKCAVLARADAVCRAGAVFLTTTTGLPVTEIAARGGRLPRTLGLHLPDLGAISAATAVELVSTPLTDEGARATVEDLLRELGKTPVRVGNHAGFVGGALVLGYLNSAAAMFEEGFGTRDGIDAAMTMGCGVPLGPLAQLDAIGIDVVHDSLEALWERTGDRVYEPAPILAKMVAADTLGRKNGHGFYTYDTTGPGRVAEPRTALSAPPPGDGVARPVRHIGIAGSGHMATGIAEVCARSGYQVTLAARSPESAARARAAVAKSLSRAVQRAKLTDDGFEAAMASLATVSGLAALGPCDLVIEAVTEDLETKRAVFAELDALVRPGAVLATITSSLSVMKCATATGRPHDVVGMHFFNPAPRMQLVEVVRTVVSDPGAVATVHEVAGSMGKHTVDCTDRAGFIVNALLFPFLNRAVAMLRERYVDVADVDRIIAGGCRFPLGPFQLLDLVGLDVSLAIQDALWAAAPDSAAAPAQYLGQLVRAGYLGRKSGRGFHSHDPHEKGAHA